MTTLIRSIAVCILFLGSALLGTVQAQSQAEMDSLLYGVLDEIVVVGTRPNERTPITKQLIKVQTLQQQTMAWDLPTMLQGMPSVVVSNDGGIGGGYSSFSIRGVDPSRVNITVNGVPMNDSESQLVFWANMPDFGSRLQDIVIVRGAGASSFGAGAFGATMDMRTRRPTQRGGVELSTYFGSYGLNRNSVSLNSGDLGYGWRAQGALSTTRSEGYVERSGGRGLSYFGQLSHQGETHTFQLIYNGGEQQTGIAWNGLTAKQEKQYGRRYNSAGVISEGVYYKNNTDNYKQGHTYAIWKHYPSEQFQYEVTLHYTRGKGFTEDYRTGRKLKEYGLTTSTPDTKKTDLVRQKHLDNHFFGGILNLLYKWDTFRLSGGASLNQYLNDHFGYLLYVKDPGVTYTPGEEYYRNHSTRLDGAGYLKGEWDLTPELMLYGDLMYRHVHATMKGLTDKWDDKKDARYQLDYDLDYNFLLPKVGINYRPLRGMDLYLSYAMAGKEPSRKNYTESRKYDAEGKLIMPRSEFLHDFELGGSYTGRTWQAFVNAYFMDYKDQLVPNGMQSDVGEAILVNVPQSYRLGLELGATWQMTRQLEVGANGTISRNRILNLEVSEVNYDKNDALETRILKETPIASSPDLIFNHHISYSPIKELNIRLTGQYVGKRYLDNFGNDEYALSGYYVGGLMLHYTPLKWVELHAQVNNLWNATYETYGWSGDQYISEGAHKSYMGYFPAAPRHFLLGVTLRL